jgi:hypothetical protein
MTFPDFAIPTAFQVTNPGQQPFTIDAEKWTLKRYQDITTNARELQITLRPDVPIQQFAEILAIDGSDVAFRGYVERYKKTAQENVFYCRGVENLLYHRYLHKFNYSIVVDSDGGQTSFTLGGLLKDHYSAGFPITRATADNCPGILHVANSLMPWNMPFTVYDATYKIIKYAGWGTKSRMGVSPTLYYMADNGVYPLTQRGALADLQTYDASFYIDANDLYIRNTTNLGAGNFGAQDFWYYSGRILANNVFDTKMRIGTIDYSNYQLVGFLKTGFKDTAASTIFSTLKSFGLFAYIYDELDATYLYAFWNAEGLHSTTIPVYTIDETERETITWEKSVPNKPHVHSLRGYGVAEQVYSHVVAPTYKGLWYEDILQITNGFRDANGTIIPTTDAEYTNRLYDYQYLIKTARKIIARPGDYVKVLPKYDPSEILPINVITNNSDGTTQLEINQKTPLLTNAWQFAGVLAGTYSNYVLHDIHDPVSGSATFNFRTAAFPACAGGSIALVVPNISNDYHSRVTLDVSLSPSVNQIPKTWEPMRFMVGIGIVQGKFNENMIIYNYAWGDTISDIDITDQVTNNATNTVWIQVYYMGGVVGSTQCSTNSQVTANVTMRFKNRKDLYG